MRKWQTLKTIPDANKQNQIQNVKKSSKKNGTKHAETFETHKERQTQKERQTHKRNKEETNTQEETNTLGKTNTQ